MTLGPIHLFDFLGPLEPVGRGLVLAALAVLWTVLLVRMVGLRSFSKMTNYDFVTTVATGSMIATAATRGDWGQFVNTLAAIAGIFLIQYLLARTRQKSDAFKHLIRNSPILLMENGRFIDKALHETRVSRSNVLEKLRNADPESIDKVRAVVLETTGDISVLTGEIDPKLLEGVNRVGEG